MKKKSKKIKKKKKKIKYIQPKPTFCGWVVWSVLGILLLPALAVSVLATFELMAKLPLLSASLLTMIIGAAVYGVIHFTVYKPMAIYVLAHEFTHALFGLLSGSQVRKIKVSSTGGYVELSQSSFLIDLAPYFFPLYSILLITIFFVANRLFDLSGYVLPFFFFLGFSLAFHFLSNWETLKLEQPDLKFTGKIFGAIFVAILNLFFLNLVLMLVFIDRVNLSDLFDSYLAAYNQLKVLFFG